LLLLFFFFALHHLETYPVAWFDEGLNFQPPRNMVLYGEYAMRSFEGFRVLDPALQTGPPVMLPVALSFRLLGIGLFQARLVLALFGILCFAVIYRVARTLYDETVGWAVMVLLLTFAADDEFLSFLYMSRQVLGEVPALLFFLSGLLLWFRSWEQAESWHLLGTGLLFGLAMVTKSQFNLLVPPTLLVTWLIGYVVFGKTLRWRHLVLPLALSVGLVLVWYGVQMVILGPRQFLLNVDTLRAGMRLHVLNFAPVTARHGFGVLTRSGYVVFGGLGLGYALWRCRRRDLATLRRLALVVFVGLWLVWYTVGSIGWARYAFVAIAVSHIFYAGLLRDALGAISTPGWAGRRGKGWRAASALVLVLVAGWMIASGFGTIGSVLQSQDESYFQFARYVNDVVPSSAVVESWEWELDLVADLQYHHPPTSVTNAVTRRLWVDGSESEIDYDFQRFAPDYLIVGSFAKATGLYPPDFLEHGCTLVGSIGEYDLYRVNRGATN
jgi:4-amino-4-deoxy-L-arabinose transferase-like glycosyltransferase